MNCFFKVLVRDGEEVVFANKAAAAEVKNLRNTEAQVGSSLVSGCYDVIRGGATWLLCANIEEKHTAAW